LSESTSCNDRAAALLNAARTGTLPGPDAIRAVGEECPAEFFRSVIEPLGDSFDAADAASYEALMSAWGLGPVPSSAHAPDKTDAVYVLSRVTLGADIKITSIVLDAMKRRYPAARIVFVTGPKSAELFAADPRVEILEAPYPRSGSVSARIAFAEELRVQFSNGIVVDPDSRITQLGLLPLCDPARYFHFSSRTAGGDSFANLTDLTAAWLRATFGVTGEAYMAPALIEIPDEAPTLAISLGVGENESKRVAGGFESNLIRALAQRHRTVWLDRGAGGEEAARVTAAAQASGALRQVRFWESGFAGFASVISQCDLYVGYDSAGQHAAAAAGTPSITIFAGAPTDRFRHRWSASGRAHPVHIDAGTSAPNQVLAQLLKFIPA
jgi:ADP-heptose:LPS heptosyltransferase